MQLKLTCKYCDQQDELWWLNEEGELLLCAEGIEKIFHIPGKIGSKILLTASAEPRSAYAIGFSGHRHRPLWSYDDTGFTPVMSRAIRRFAQGLDISPSTTVWFYVSAQPMA